MSKSKILIVDDEPHIVEMLKLRLEANDFEVRSAYNGPDALSLLAKERDFDVVMSDIMMPGMDGIEFMRKSKASYPDIEFIIMTGFASLDTAIEAVRLGAYDYIRKPFEDIQILMRTINFASEKKRLLAENKKLNEDLKATNDRLKRINLMLGDNVNELVMLHHIVESISGTISVDDVMLRFLENLVSSLDFRKALLFLINEAQGILELKSNFGLDKDAFGSVIISLDEEKRDIIRALSMPQPMFLSGFKKEFDDALLKKVVDERSISLIYLKPA